MASIIKEVLMRKIWKIPIYFLIALIGASVATAAVMYTLKIPGEITVLPAPAGEYEIKIYEDADRTTEVTSFIFPSVVAGGRSTSTFYIENLSPADTYVDISVVDQSSESIIVGHTGWHVGPIEPDAVYEYTFTIDVSNEAEAGTYYFNVQYEVIPA